MSEQLRLVQSKLRKSVCKMQWITTQVRVCFKLVAVLPSLVSRYQEQPLVSAVLLLLIMAESMKIRAKL